MFDITNVGKQHTASLVLQFKIVLSGLHCTRQQWMDATEPITLALFIRYLLL